MLMEGKVAAITGASRGMGAAFARRLAAEGAAVSIIGARRRTPAVGGRRGGGSRRGGARVPR